MKTFIFIILLVLIGFVARSGIIQEIMRGYNIVQLIDKGSLKTITIEEYKNLTRYKRYFDFFMDHESDEVQDILDRLEKFRHDGPTMACLNSPSKCDE